MRRALITLLALTPACAFPPRLGTEPDTGRRAITWGPPQKPPAEGGPSVAAAVAAETAQERELRGTVRAADTAGRDDLALAGALYELAIIRRQQGALDEAAALYERALAIRERLQGPSHPDVATVLNNLAAVEVARERYARAMPLLQRAFEVRERALGGTDMLTVQTMSNLALLHAAQGDASVAEPLYQRAIAALEAMDPPRPADLDRVLANYAALLRDTGREAEAGRVEARARLRPSLPAVSRP